MITLEKYVSAESTIKNLGTVKSLIPKGTLVDFLAKNLTNDEKRVVVHFRNGELTKNISCTDALSKVVRKALKTSDRKAVLNIVATLPVIQNEIGHFISLPATATGISIDELGNDEPKSLEAFMALAV